VYIEIQAVCICIQETTELFRDVRKLARTETSQRKTKLISLLVECKFVELIQKIWKHLRPELLEQEDLPDHILASLGVNTHTFDLAFSTNHLQCCNLRT